MKIHVFVDDWSHNPIVAYVFDYNDPRQRAVFAEQAANALAANQIVTTMLASSPR